MQTKGKTIIVTGAAKGIGAGVTNAFIKRGYNVVTNSLNITASTFAATDRLAVARGDIGDPSTAHEIGFETKMPALLTTLSGANLQFVAHNFGTSGISLSYDAFDFGRHGSAIRERDAVVRLCTEGERIAENRLTQGVMVVSARPQAPVASLEAQAEVPQAQLAHLLARAEREQTIGRDQAH